MTNFDIITRIPMGHRLFFIRISRNNEYIQTHCNDLNNSFHFACHQWYSYNKIELQKLLLYNYMYTYTNNNIIIFILV